MNGVPFANVVAYQYGVELAVMHPGKHQTEIGMHQTVHPTLSENYADVKGKRCVIVDDVITTGSTMEEAIKLIEDHGGETVAIAVMLDKRGADAIDTVPVRALIKIGRVG
jgi:orotate phosphoribosyltransferase